MNANLKDETPKTLEERFLAAFNPAPQAHGWYTTQGEAIAGQKFLGKAETKLGPVELADVGLHIKGRLRLGFIAIHRESSLCWFGAIDIDKYDGLDLKVLAAKVERLKLPLIVCSTKSGGAHCYAFWNGAPAEKVRQQLEEWAALIWDGKTEVFPKQDDLGPTGKGNWINAPYFGDKTYAIDGAGQRLTLEQFLARVEEVRGAKPGKVKAAAEEEALPLEFNLDVAVDILLPFWVSDRHLLTLKVAGALLRHRVDEENVCVLIDRVVLEAHDEEPEKRRQAVIAAADALEKGTPMFGIKALREVLEEATTPFLAACGVPSDAQEVAALTEFRAHLPSHEYIYLPTGALWPAASVDALLRPMPLPHGKKMIKASAWLDRNRPVHQMTWAPGLPKIITGKLVDSGGWIAREDAAVFNLYQPPQLQPGNARGAGRWLRMMRKVWPHYGRRHIIRYMAHRVQRPQEKINHALLLGGAPGIGKDTLLEPLKYGVGPWNFKEVNPTHLLGRFNGFVKAVVLRISEARDLGDVNRYALYEHLKVFEAAPPDVLRCDEKNLREHDVFNLCGVIVTTNHRTGGFYLPEDDRRHFVVWSERTQADFSEREWREFWEWYGAGGIWDVVAYLQEYNLSNWDPKAPPPKTPAFWEVVDSERAPEASELADAIEQLGDPAVLALDMLRNKASAMLRSTEGQSELAAWLDDRKNRRAVPHRLADAGYIPVRNGADQKNGLWKVRVADESKRVALYGRMELSEKERLVAAAEFCKCPHAAMMTSF